MKGNTNANGLAPVQIPITKISVTGITLHECICWRCGNVVQVKINITTNREYSSEVAIARGLPAPIVESSVSHGTYGNNQYSELLRLFVIEETNELKLVVKDPEEHKIVLSLTYITKETV